MDARLSRRRTPSRRGREFLPALLVLIALGVSITPRLAAAQGAGSDTLTLVWTAPGDDGQVGTAARYEVRLSTSPISTSNWDSAWLVGGAPAPLPAGTRQRLVVRGLTQGTTYYFAIRAVDDADNMAAISNVVRWDWILDTAPPAAPTGVSAAVENTTNVRVRWSANSEADLAGYTVYRKLTSSGAWQVVSSPGLTGTQFVDSAVPAGTSQVWYQITASDVNGNESARSATSTASFGGASAAATFELQPAYPNPSRSPAAINIPLSVPSGGAGAELLVMDSGGRRVRRLAVGVSGPQLVVWDGRNESGSWVAPGIYTAWLIGAGERRSIKLVRQP